MSDKEKREIVERSQLVKVVLSPHPLTLIGSSVAEIVKGGRPDR